MKAICKYCLKTFEAARSTRNFCTDTHRTLFGRLSDEEKAQKVAAYLKAINVEIPLDKVKTKKVKVGKYKIPVMEVPGMPAGMMAALNNQLSGQIANKPVFDHEKINKRLKELEWVKRVEEYCNQSGCTPDDLIEAHQHKTTTIKVKNFEAIKEMGKKLEQKKNISVNKRKEYNPFENRFFNIKTPSSKAKT